MKTDLLASRHIGINEQDTALMLRKIGVNSLDELIDKTIPANIRLKEPLALTSPLTEYEFGKHIAELAGKNKLYTTYIGMGWYNTITPAVIVLYSLSDRSFARTPGSTDEFPNCHMRPYRHAACQLLTLGRSDCGCRSRKYDVRPTFPCATESQCERSFCRREYFPTNIGCYDYTRRAARHRTACR